MPSESVRMATAVSPGLRRSIRAAYRRSCTRAPKTLAEESGADGPARLVFLHAGANQLSIMVVEMLRQLLDDRALAVARQAQRREAIANLRFPVRHARLA